jgi:Concanavalin A-like lectin/glucanases superfamily
MKIIFQLLYLLPTLCFSQVYLPAFNASKAPTSLVLNYDFDNPASYIGTGTSVNNLNSTSAGVGTLANGPVYYQNPGYIKFDGVNDYLITNDLQSYYSPLSGYRSEAFTVSFWFNPINNSGVILSDIGTNAINANYHTADIEMVNGYLKFSVWPKTTVITTNSTLILNNWYHVTMVYTGNQLVAYLNGILVGSATYSRVGPQNTSIYNSGSSTAQYFGIAATDGTNMGSGAYGNFLLTNFNFFASPIGAADVLNDYNINKSRFDLVLDIDASNNNLSYPGSGTNWYDVSGAGKLATNGSGAAYNTAASGSMYYNGTTTGFTDFSFNLGSASTITVEMWVFPTTLSGGMFFGFYNYDVWTNNGGLGFNSSSADQYGLTNTQVTALGLLNSWKHYVFVMNTNSYLNNKIYINGSMQVLSQVIGSQNTSALNLNSGVGRIASWLSSNYMQQMYMTNFKVYNRELTQTEINAKFNKTKSRYGL